MSEIAPFKLVTEGSVSSGPLRRPTNFSKGAAGSIHDDTTAQKLGFRGGTVAGNIHFDQFSPLLVGILGKDWLKRGGLSLYFRNAMTDGEAVRCFAKPSAEQSSIKRLDVWMEREDGLLVCEGSASLGEDPKSALRTRLKDLREPKELRILAGAKVGATITGVQSRVTLEQSDPRVAVTTEPLAFYRAPLPERMPPPAVAIDALRVVETKLVQARGNYVGMFGAIELQMLDGPVLVEHDYEARGRIVGLEDSPKTEILWYESTLSEPRSLRDVARLIMMTRVLKASSPLWTS
jgi:hypothetical protein